MADEDEEHQPTCWERHAPTHLRDKLFSGRRPPLNRKIHVDNKPLPGEDTVEFYNYPDNRVVSSKYTFLTFLPKNLFEQFRRIANFYFLCVALTQFMIDTPVTPITSVLPLLFVISITAIKQGYEDYLRHNADKEVNLRPTVIIRNGQVQRGLRAMDVQVGDIVKTYINEEFPCDMVLLSSEDHKGHCFITTANLDGETNLKTHYSQQETLKLRTPQALGTLRATITCKPQTADLYTFQGVMHFGHDADPQPLGPEHLLLRGARLKNTPWIYGCAIYTGKETKMALNSNAKKAKFSRVERKLNTFLILFLIILVLGCIVPTGIMYWFKADKGDDPWYFYEEGHSDKKAHDVLEAALAFMVLINYIIPISLYVTIEMQKFFGSLFFNYDVEMYDEYLNEPAMANTSDLNEELGQVEYLFTDKTGTLTENTMTFRKCIIGKHCFEEVNGMLCEKIGEEMIAVSDPAYTHSPEEMTDFLRVLVLCHTVRVDRQLFYDHNSESSMNENANANSHFWSKWHRKKHHGSRDSLEKYYEEQEKAANRSNNAKKSDVEYSETGQEYQYQASSPDEKAFVEACCKYGTIYHGMVGDVHEVSYNQEIHRFKLLETLPFDAIRKRMSVIIRDTDGDIFLLCKGADIAIFDRVIHGDVEITQKCIDEYAMCGYRTLCLARRKLTEEEYQKLSDELAEARLSLVDRDAKIAEVYNDCEKDLTLLGATAVEDKLQEDVPETITALREAGIKVWVLTGDKEETAVNISHSAGHFRADMIELRLTQVSSSDQCEQQLLHLLKQVRDAPAMPKLEYSLTVDGKSLAYALRKHPLWFRELCSYCVAVLCCRMSPMQKAEVVTLIKNSPEQPVTAAIGDGANDVSMIQEADVGFGIMGKEGRQAVCNSDYAFGKFRFLRRALLLHGHYYYHRLAILVKYFFYKNVAWITCQLYFAIFSYWSQQSLYDPFHLTFYNMTSTSLPILIYGIFEQCKPKTKLFNHPQLYKSITRNASLSWPVFLEWMVLALWHSLVFFFAMYFLEEGNTSLYSSGYGIGVYDFGTAIAYNGILAVNLKLMLETYFWCWPMVFSYCFAAVGSILMAIVYTSVFWPSWVTSKRDLYGVPSQVYQSLSVWLCLVITVIIALLPDYVLRTVRDHRDSLQEIRLDKMKSLSNVSSWTVSKETESFTVPRYSESSTSTDPPRREGPSSMPYNSRFMTNGRISLALGKAEMTQRSRQALPMGASDIELHDVNQNYTYGTMQPAQIRRGYDSSGLSGSYSSTGNVADIPAVATVGPRQRHQRRLLQQQQLQQQQQQQQQQQLQQQQQPHLITQHHPSPQALPDGNSVSVSPNFGYPNGSAPVEIHNSDKTIAPERDTHSRGLSSPIYSTQAPFSGHSDPNPEAQTVKHSLQDPSDIPAHNGGISAPDLLQPPQPSSHPQPSSGYHDNQVTPGSPGVGSGFRSSPSQPSQHRPEPYPTPSAVHIPAQKSPLSSSLSEPKSTSDMLSSSPSPLQPSSSSSSLPQPHFAPAISTVTSDSLNSGGHDNPVFSLASEKTLQDLPKQQGNEGEKPQEKKMPYFDVIVRL